MRTTCRALPCDSTAATIWATERGSPSGFHDAYGVSHQAQRRLQPLVRTNTDGNDLAYFWALGNIANLTFTKSGNVSALGWACSAFTGVDNATPIDAIGTATNTISSTTVTVGTVSVATNNAWHLVAACEAAKSATLSATSFTIAESGNTNEHAALLYNTTPKSVGATGTVTVTSTDGTGGQTLIGFAFAIRPDAAASARRRVSSAFF